MFQSNLMETSQIMTLTCVISINLSCQSWLNVLHLLLQGLARHVHETLRKRIRLWAQMEKETTETCVVSDSDKSKPKPHTALNYKFDSVTMEG